MATPVSLRKRITPSRSALPRLAAAVVAITLEMIFIGNIATFTQVWWVYGLGLVGCAVVTGVLGISLLFTQPSQFVARLGVIACAGMIVIWALVRFGGGLVWDRFEPWPIGVRDIAVLILLIALAGMLAPGTRWRRPAQPAN